MIKMSQTICIVPYCRSITLDPISGTQREVFRLQAVSSETGHDSRLRRIARKRKTISAGIRQGCRELESEEQLSRVVHPSGQLDARSTYTDHASERRGRASQGGPRGPSGAWS